MRHLRTRAGPGAREERGFALATVMLVTFALLGLTAAFVEYGVGSQFVSHHDENWNGALSAAQAGVDDYLYRLDANPNYVLYGAPPSPAPPDGNGAFTGWVDVPGAASGSAQFRYDVNVSANQSSLAKGGYVTLTSTGKVGNATRTVQVTLRQESFVDFLYLTDLETQDPRINASQPASCGKATPQEHRYAFGSVPAYSSWCNKIFFITGDTINGPLHTNDTLYLCGSPTFNDEASTTSPGSDQGSPRWRTLSGCSNSPAFNGPGGDLIWRSLLPFPSSNQNIKQLTAQGQGGCLYTGPTRITLNSDGTMDVYSPFTRVTYNGCQVGSHVALPASGVVYVQHVPASSSDPNYWPSCTQPPTSQPFLASGKPLALPRINEYLDYGFSYPCLNGDALVQGTLKGQLTINTENNLVITGPITYAGGHQGRDLLGLEANQFVEVYHPVSSTKDGSGHRPELGPASGGWPPGALQNPEVDAAIFALNDSFAVQNWDQGYHSNVGTLTVFGAIAQENRGPVGTFGGVGTGYLKNYNYDSRLHYLEPPYFLNPQSTQFHQATWAEFKPAYGP